MLRLAVGCTLLLKSLKWCFNAVAVVRSSMHACSAESLDAPGKRGSKDCWNWFFERQLIRYPQLLMFESLEFCGRLLPNGKLAKPIIDAWAGKVQREKRAASTQEEGAAAPESRWGPTAVEHVFRVTVAFLEPDYWSAVFPCSTCSVKIF